MQLLGSGRPWKNRGAPFRFIALKCLDGYDTQKEGTQMTKTEGHRLYAALRSLKTDEEAAAFLGDLCTPREIDDLSQRLEVAVMLGADKAGHGQAPWWLVSWRKTSSRLERSTPIS